MSINPSYPDVTLHAAVTERHESHLEIGTGQIQKGDEQVYEDMGYLWDAALTLEPGQALVVWAVPLPQPEPVQVPSTGRFYVVNGKVRPVEEVGGISLPSGPTLVKIQMKEYPK